MSDAPIIKRNWKYYLGIILFIYSFIPYIATGLIFFFNVPIGQLIALIGAFLTSAEVSFAISIVLLGKPFLLIIKTKFKSLFKRNEEPRVTKPISKLRHYIGITLLLLSFFPDLLVITLLFLGSFDTETGNMILLAIMLGGTTLFITGLFVMGSGFWDRLQNLFKWQNNELTV
ncbi:MAG: transporter suffix domain-containing protein [Bacteroidota bacterium]